MKRARSAGKDDGRIRYLHSKLLANGTVKWVWKPSPLLRKNGWTYIELGFDRVEAMKKAIDRNEEVKAWEQGRAVDTGGTRTPRHNRVWTYGELVDDYEKSTHFLTELSARTQYEYQQVGKWLLRWAQDGETRVVDMTRDVCVDLRNDLVENCGAATTAMRLRVLNNHMTHAVNRRIIGTNPATKLDIPTSKSRKKRIVESTMWIVANRAFDTERDHVGMAVLLGFYSVQRQKDLLAAKRGTLRQMDDMEEADLMILANDDGEAWGLRIQQTKTGAWVDAQLPPDVATMSRESLARRDRNSDGPIPIAAALLVDPRSPTVACPNWQLRRDFRDVVNELLAEAQAAGDTWLADQLTGFNYQDLRRSGMCWMRDHGSTAAQIAAQSGHSITYTQKVLDTYLPGDGRASAAGMAHALRTRAKRQAQTKNKATDLR